MLDKIWHDWQKRNPTNAYSFFGGSVEHLASLDDYNQYPNGGPPYPSVRTCQFIFRNSYQTFDFIAEFNHVCGRTLSGSHHQRRDEHNWWLLVLRI